MHNDLNVVENLIEVFVFVLVMGDRAVKVQHEFNTVNIMNTLAIQKSTKSTFLPMKHMR